MARPQKSYIGQHKAVTVIQAHTRDVDGNLLDTDDERTTGGRVVFYTTACGRCSAITLRRKSVVRDGFVCPTCDNACKVDPPDPFKLTPAAKLFASQAMPRTDNKPNAVIFHLGTTPRTTKKISVSRVKDAVDALRSSIVLLSPEEHVLWSKADRLYEIGYLKSFFYREGQLGEKVIKTRRAPVAPPVEASAAPSVEASAAPSVEAPAAPSVEASAAPSVEASAAPPVEAPVAPPVEASAAPPVEALTHPSQGLVEALQALAETTPPPPPLNRYDEKILQYNEGYTENMTALATELALDPPPATWTTDGYLVSQWSMNVLKEDRQPLPKPHGWYKTFPTTPATSDARWLWMNNGDTTARDNALFDVSDLFDGFDE